MKKLSLTEVFLAVGEKLNIPEVSWVKINLAKLRQNPETELFPKKQSIFGQKTEHFLKKTEHFLKKTEHLHKKLSPAED